MEVIFFGFVVSAYNTKYKKKKSQLFRLTNSVTLSQLKMSHACIKKQIPSVCRWCKYLIGGSVVLEEKNHVDISGSVESPFLIYSASST